MDIIVETDKLKVARLVLSRWRVNAYILICPQTGESALVDAPPEAQALVKALEGTRPRYVLLTHGHIDHIAGLSGVMNQVKAPLAIHAGDRDRVGVAPGVLLNDGDILAVGKIRIKVIHTPGHTPGSVCFQIGEHLLSGDTLFPGGPGRTDSEADFQQIIRSIPGKLFVLPEETQVYPGHGAFTNIKKEKEEFKVFSSKKHDPGIYGDVSWLKS